ncbi:MAG TPA: hypothetical protein VHE09_02485 [Rhizomicrobium sp.]|nr:hypothetical protein [Rhizomicrobium sp.]
MLEYENIAYLDLQKTGSSTIKQVLSDVLDEAEIYSKSHKGIREDFDRSKLCFISVREPLSLYISLFSFGAGSRMGNLYKTLKRKGLEDLFAPTCEAFEHWLEFVLDPANASVLRSEYGEAPNDTIGLLSYRLLYVSVPNALRRMQKPKYREREQLRKLLARHLYVDHVRLENLGGDLFAFLKCHSARLHFRRPLTTPEALTAQIPVRNPSPKIAGLIPERVSPELRQRVREREWLFYEAFGYDADASGRPPKCLNAEAKLSP